MINLYIFNNYFYSFHNKYKNQRERKSLYKSKFNQINLTFQDLIELYFIYIIKFLLNIFILL